MNQIFLLSEARACGKDIRDRQITKPETVIEGECEGMRMRLAGEVVHYRADEDNRTCAVCGRPALVWLGSEERHAGHPARCGVMFPRVIRGWRR